MMLIKIENKNEYQKSINSNVPIGIYFSSSKCGVCNTMKPQVLGIFEENNTILKELVVDDNVELTAQQLIMTSPTVILYQNGKEVFRESGFLNLEKINRNLKIINENIN